MPYNTCPINIPFFCTNQHIFGINQQYCWFILLVCTEKRYVDQTGENKTYWFDRVNVGLF